MKSATRSLFLNLLLGSGSLLAIGELPAEERFTSNTLREKNLQEALPTPQDGRQAVEPATPSAPEPILEPTTQQAIQPQAARFAEATAFGTQFPNISSIHEFDHPPFAYISGETKRIRNTRFEVDVVGLNPTTECRLLACFDGETIGDSGWFIGHDSYSIPTQVGFPPGRYCLTVQVVQRDGSNGAMRTPPAFVDYQPTYLREMQHRKGRDVTAVTSHRAISHRRSENGVELQQIRVRFVGLDDWDVYTRSARVNRFELEPSVFPRRRSFTQGHTYQLKIKHDADEFYPTLEFPRTFPDTAAFLTHNAVSVELKQPDVDYVQSGGMLTKVMYLPHRADHSTRANCVKTLVSRCPGDCQDPLVEATRYGTVLAILRLGDRDLD